MTWEADHKLVKKAPLFNAANSQIICWKNIDPVWSWTEQALTLLSNHSALGPIHRLESPTALRTYDA